MARTLKIAMTETVNAYRGMPDRVEDLPKLEGRLEDIRRANVDHHVALIEQAAGLGVKAIGLGEMFPAPYFALRKDPLFRAMAEDAEDGPTVRALRKVAEEKDIVIVAPIYEQAKSGKRFNTAVVIDAGGEILGRYRKTHIPEGRNEQGEFAEPFYFGPSDETIGEANAGRPANISDNPYFPVFATRAGRIGVSICYDRHFEGVVRSLAQGGAELIFSPAVTFGAKSERMWEMEFVVDAARHRVFIAGSNRRGTEPPWNQPYFGKSYVAGPEGRVPLETAPEGLVVATVDLDKLADTDTSGWKLVRDRRPGIYTP